MCCGTVCLRLRPRQHYVYTANFNDSVGDLPILPTALDTDTNPVSPFSKSNTFPVVLTSRGFRLHPPQSCPDRRTTCLPPGVKSAGRRRPVVI